MIFLKLSKWKIISFLLVYSFACKEDSAHYFNNLELEKDIFKKIDSYSNSRNEKYIVLHFFHDSTNDYLLVSFYDGLSNFKSNYYFERQNKLVLCEFKDSYSFKTYWKANNKSKTKYFDSKNTTYKLDGGEHFFYSITNSILNKIEPTNEIIELSYTKNTVIENFKRPKE